MTQLYNLFSNRQQDKLQHHPKSCYIFAFLILFLLFAGNAAAQNGGCPPNIAHHFGFDEKQSGTYIDRIKGTEATCTNCPAPTTGIYGGSQQFDGVNDGVVINDIAAFEWGPNSNFTIELWVKTSARPSDNQIIIGRKAKENGMIWWVGMDKEGRAVFALWNNVGTGMNIGYGTKKINDGKWHHIMVVRDGVNRANRLYVDGFSTAVSSPANYEDGTFDKSTSPVTVGYLELNNGYRFQGQIDELMVYRNYALSEVEARARYNNGSGNYCGTEQAAPIIISEAITYGVVGQGYRYKVEATGNPAPTYSLATSPAGMAINSTTGEITWAPGTSGTFDVSVKATNGVGEASQSYKITIKKSISEQTGLLHHWPLHEPGTEYKDYYTPHHARSMGSSKPEPVSGVVSGGQRFDGKGDDLDVMGSKNFDWEPGESFTIELWMRTDISSSNNRVMIGRQGKPESEPPLHWWLGINKDGQALFNLNDINREGTYIGQTGPRLDDGIWHQVVAVKDGAALKLFVDGEQIAAGSFNYNHSFAISSNVNIGYLDGQDPVHNGYRYHGDLDEVKLFGRPLSADEIKQNYTDVFNGLMELVKFEGVYRNGVVVLDWETLNEVNCKSFTIERSPDKENFTAIGEVAGSGNSTQPIAYTFTDQEPLKENAYYRLKINRTDGTFTYSNVILIEPRSLNTTTFKIYPNPVLKNTEQEVTVEMQNLAPDETIIFFIADLAGRKLMEQEITVESDGRLTFTVPTSVTAGLQSGMYMFTVVTKIKRISRKLMVVQ